MPTMPETSETRANPDLFLARRAAAGQAAAWDEILALYGERLYNLAFQFAGSVPEAEDLTQEIFLRLFQNLRRYDGEAPLVAWALRLSRNLCIDHYRRMRQERRSVAVSEEILKHVAATDDPQAETQRRQEIAAVYRALEEMPEALAEVVLLRDLQGWSLEETAAAIGVPVGTVKSRLHRGRLEVADRVTARFCTRWPEAAAPSTALGVSPC
jgi:RNA polymerase sigma-70 factor (ECF subfamily)